MKRLLFLILLFSAFSGCSNDSDSESPKKSAADEDADFILSRFIHTHQVKKGQINNIRLTMNEEGKVFFEDRHLEDSLHPEVFKKVHRQMGRANVTVIPEKETPYICVLVLFETLKKAGFRQIALKTSN